MKLSEESLVAIMMIVCDGLSTGNDVSDVLRSLTFVERSGSVDLTDDMKDLLLHGKKLS